MAVLVENLIKRYESMSDNELISLYLDSELADDAYSVLKDIIFTRGINEERIKGTVTDKKVKQSELTQPGIVTATFPKMWIGYIIGITFLLYEIIEVIIDPNSSDKILFPLIFISIIGWSYWLFCVERIHKVIEQFTNGTHPISPSKAVGFHFIPFYNFYWIFKWPNEIANLANNKKRSKFMSKGWVGVFILLAVFLGRVVDSSLGLVTLFSLGVYLNKKVRKVIESYRMDSTSLPNE
jgi:hypothetical protein